MKSDITDILSARLIGEKVNALEEILVLLRGDIASVMGDYLRITGDVFIGADIDEHSGDIIISVHAKAREVYEYGKILKA